MIRGSEGQPAMSTLVTGEALKTAVKDQTFVKDGEASAVETVKYDLRLGSTVLKAAYGLPMEIERIPEEKRWIDPGEVVFVVTKDGWPGRAGAPGQPSVERLLAAHRLTRPAP